MSEAVPSWPIATLILFVVVMIAYGGSLAGGFVWDDEWLIVSNESLSLARIPQLATEPYHGPADPEIRTFYRPVMMVSLLVDTIVWGRTPAGFHATNLLLHLGVALAVFAIARHSLPKDPWSGLACLLAACLWAVLPAHAEVVAFVSGRADILAALFSLVSLAFYAGQFRVGTTASLLASATAALAAMLSKESAMVLPLILVLWDLLTPPSGRRMESRLLRWSVAFTPLALAVAVRSIVFDSPIAFAASPLPPGQRLATLVSSVFFYWIGLIWPGLSPRADAVISPISSPFDLRFITGLATGLAIVVLAALWSRRERAAMRGLVIAGVSLTVFAISFPIVAAFDSPFPAAERLLYFPSVGLALAGAFPLQRLLGFVSRRRSASARVAWLAPVLAVFAAWSVCSELRAASWRDPLRLFEALSRNSPESSRLRYHLALAYERAGRVRDALSEYQQAVRLSPDSVRARNELGRVYQAVGLLAEAEREYRSALEQDPSQGIVRFNLATLLQVSGRLQEAIAAYRESIRTNPQLAEAHVHLGDALKEVGDAKGALESYGEATRIDPHHGEARARFGAALAAAGERERGMAEMFEGLRLDPTDSRVRNDLGAALSDAGRFADALPLLDEAVTKWPDDPKAHYNRGNALRGLGRREEAAAAYRKALGLSPLYDRALNNLAVTLHEMGKNEEALGALDDLLKVRPDARAHNNKGLILRALDRSEQARREFELAASLDPSFPEPRQHLQEMGGPPSATSSRN